ncbi:phage structural protein [Marinibaculum pumilum]|uniref:Phage structural protein n=1 Tax=Marinibaculum pumilum TaxID=1766165 RepID=A0ABV7KYU4_9PROT
MAVKTYDPRDVQVIIGGFSMTGYADGTYVSVTSDEAAYNKTIGADGEVSRARTNNRSGTMTLTLKQTSASNDVLTGFAIADETANGGVFPAMVKEVGSGRTLLFAAAAWIQQWPDVGYSKEIGNREWTIALATIDRFVGGNADSGA